MHSNGMRTARLLTVGGGGSASGGGSAQPWGRSASGGGWADLPPPCEQNDT